MSVIALRLAAQMLTGPPARDPVDVAARLLAIQAQDARGARLAVRARTTGLTAADVDRALDGRRLVVSWLNRGTLHMVRSEDYFWLHALTAPGRLTATHRRLRQEGVSPSAAERGVAVIERALSDDGPLRAADLRERLNAAGVPTAGQALVHVLALAVLRGVAVRGPMMGGEQAYALVRDWLGPAPHVDRETALTELARRYLAGHAPAGDRDLARWAGLALRDARAGLAVVAASARRRADGLLELEPRHDAGELPPPRLLGSFDPCLHGWTSRDDLLGEHRDVVTRNGVFRPFALVRGHAVATWAWRAGRVRLEPLEAIADDELAALEADAVDVARFLGGA